MRIVLAITEYVTEPNGDGGLAGYVARTAAALAAAGHEPLVVTCSDRDGLLIDNAVPVQRVDIRMPTGLRRLDAATAHRFAAPIGMRWASRRIHDAIAGLHARQRLDVAHYTNLGALAWLRPELPLVVRVSSHRALCAAAGDSLSGGWHGLLKHRLEVRALHRAEVVFGPAPAVATAIAAETGRHILLVANPFPAGTPVEAKTPDGVGDRPFVLVAGSLAPHKGTRIVAMLIAELLNRHPELALAWAGKEVGAGGEGERLRAAAGRHAERVILLGTLTRPALAAAMSAASVVLVPSLFDNLPNAGLEALAAGAIVVVSRGTGLDTMINDGRNGFLCRPGDATDLLTTSERALALSADQRAAMRSAAIATMIPLRPENTLDRLLAVYRLAIKRYRGKQR